MTTTKSGHAHEGVLTNSNTISNVLVGMSSFAVSFNINVSWLVVLTVQIVSLHDTDLSTVHVPRIDLKSRTLARYALLLNSYQWIHRWAS